MYPTSMPQTKPMPAAPDDEVWITVPIKRALHDAARTAGIDVERVAREAVKARQARGLERLRRGL